VIFNCRNEELETSKAIGPVDSVTSHYGDKCRIESLTPGDFRSGQELVHFIVTENVESSYVDIATVTM
jgi:hypothetical protein